MNRLKIVLKFRIRAWRGKLDRVRRRWRRVGAPVKVVQMELRL